MGSPVTFTTERPASDLLPETPGVVQQSRPRVRAERRPPRTRLDPYPRDPVRRWMLRLAFSVPFLVAAFISAANPTPLADSRNAQLVEQVGGIPWNSVNASWLSDIYPPLTTLLAALTPGGRLGLGIVGALAAGILLQRILTILVQRRVPLSTTIILMIALAGNPLFFFMAVENLPAFLGLALFGIGLADVVRFVNWGNTQSGFRAGLLLMLAALSDLSGLLYVATAALAAPFLRHRRAHQPGVRGANVLVIVYPTLGAFGSMILLNLIFLGRPFGPLGQQLMAGAGERFVRLIDVFGTPTGWLLVAPVLCAWLIALIVKRPGAIIVSSLVFLALLGAFVLGLVPPGSAGNTYIMMILLAIALIPTARTPATTTMVDLVAIVQIVIAWLTAVDRPIVHDWMNSLVSVVSAQIG